MGKDGGPRNPPTYNLVSPSCCSACGSEEPESLDVDPTPGSLKTTIGALAGPLVGEAHIRVPLKHTSFPTRSCYNLTPTWGANHQTATGLPFWLDIMFGLGLRSQTM